jgi:hypothetical protein
LSGATSDTATGIKSNGDISGFATLSDGNQVGFLLKNGSFQTISFPGATTTQALGVNGSDEVVGLYTMGSGNNVQTFGFTRTLEHINGATNLLPVFQTINAPNTTGTTTINGLDYCGNVVGFYNDANGNTNGQHPQRGHSRPDRVGGVRVPQQAQEEEEVEEDDQARPQGLLIRGALLHRQGPLLQTCRWMAPWGTSAWAPRKNARDY